MRQNTRPALTRYAQDNSDRLAGIMRSRILAMHAAYLRLRPYLAEGQCEIDDGYFWDFEDSFDEVLDVAEDWYTRRI